jgi:hypothetical protein
MSVTFLASIAAPVLAYPTVILKSEDLEVTVFTPPTQEGEQAYYTSTRFDWGTMVGDVKFGKHVLFPSDFWSMPHDPQRSEAGVGIASEFGCGEPGTTCGAGWGAHEAGAVNGVLGFEEAAEGEAFLKMGVGKLLKDGSTDYSPFQDWTHVELPSWTLTPLHQGLLLEHAAELEGGRWGYALSRKIVLEGATLSYETELRNTGSQDFRTPHYSHSFFSADHREVGEGWQVTLDTDLGSFEDDFPWAVPLSAHWELASNDTLRATSSMGSDKSKAVFASPDHGATGKYQASFGNLSMINEMTGPLPLYCFNFYTESTTISPEPMQMLEVASGMSVKWSHRLIFSEAEATATMLV